MVINTPSQGLGPFWNIQNMVLNNLISILQKKHQDNINIINSINPESDIVMSGGKQQRQMQKGGKKIWSRTNKSIKEFLNSKVTFSNIVKRMTVNKRKSKMKPNNKYKYSRRLFHSLEERMALQRRIES